MYISFELSILVDRPDGHAPAFTDQGRDEREERDRNGDGGECPPVPPIRGLRAFP